MSIEGSLLGVSSAQIAAMRATPSLARDVVRVSESDRFRATADALVRQMSPEQRRIFDAQRAAQEAMPEMREIRALVDAARERVAPIGPLEELLELGKSWHLLHYVFTGHAGAASAPGDALMTGESLNGDAGYGPARLHGPAATQVFARFLAALDLARLQARVNVQEMQRLYIYPSPKGDVTELEGEWRNVLASDFPRLRDYVVRASEKQNGLLIWLS
jgi:hypothetical protein